MSPAAKAGLRYRLSKRRLRKNEHPFKRSARLDKWGFHAKTKRSEETASRKEQRLAERRKYALDAFDFQPVPLTGNARKKDRERKRVKYIRGITIQRRLGSELGKKYRTKSDLHPLKTVYHS